MATGKSYFSRQPYRFLPTDHHHHHHHQNDSVFELDESDIYNSTTTTTQHSPDHFTKPSRYTTRKSSSSSSSSSSSITTAAVSGGTPASLPVNIPDWSKILKQEYRDNRRSDGGFDCGGGGSDDDDDDDDVDGRGRVPPHEYLARQMARTRIASFSVHEGKGRTLKGRDLSRVRNAIWEKTGFQD